MMTEATEEQRTRAERRQHATDQRTWKILAEKERDEARVERDELREALERFGGHLHDCRGRDGGEGPKGRPCSCGWGFCDDDTGARFLLDGPPVRRTIGHTIRDGVKHPIIINDD